MKLWVCKAPALLALDAVGVHTHTHLLPLGTLVGLRQFPVGCSWRVQTPPTCNSASLLQMMQTNIPGVFAAGDTVMFPLALRNNKKVNVPHWQMAHMHGRCFSVPLQQQKLLEEKSHFLIPRKFPTL